MGSVGTGLFKQALHSKCKNKPNKCLSRSRPFQASSAQQRQKQAQTVSQQEPAFSSKLCTANAKTNQKSVSVGTGLFRQALRSKCKNKTKTCLSRNRCPTLGNHCPNIGQPLPKHWATIAQALGNHCPSIGQPLPNLGQPLPKHWATSAQALGNHCPSLGQPLPKLWVLGAPAPGVRNPRHQLLSLSSGCLGFGTPDVSCSA